MTRQALLKLKSDLDTDGVATFMHSDLVMPMKGLPALAPPPKKSTGALPPVPPFTSTAAAKAAPVAATLPAAGETTPPGPPLKKAKGGAAKGGAPKAPPSAEKLLAADARKQLKLVGDALVESGTWSARFRASGIDAAVVAPLEESLSSAGARLRDAHTGLAAVLAAGADVADSIETCKTALASYDKLKLHAQRLSAPVAKPKAKAKSKAAATA
jgi:hypothetical protein